MLTSGKILVVVDYNQMGHPCFKIIDGTLTFMFYVLFNSNSIMTC